MFSIVATETSVLTFVSVPGLAYRGDWFFLQLAMGYILGRVLVSIFLLPQYFKGDITSIYEVLGSRFGKPVQKTASGIFLITRLFADGVRFLATAVVVQVVTGWPIWLAVLIIGVVTMVYTLSGGIRTVLWVDSFQFILYLAGGAIVIFFILNSVHISAWEPLVEAGKTRIFRFTTDNMFTDTWFFGSAFFGGVLLSFASHGADYMMVQRVLTCGNLNSAHKAMIGSGFLVLLQFAIFLLAGSLIWTFTGGIELTKDRELSTFIVNHLPVGVRGILLAGVLSAAMSTLSSSINSLASSTIHDWMKKNISLKQSMMVSGVWAILLILLALLFDEGNTAVVVLGLKIASFTYGGLLGLFILARSKQKFPYRDTRPEILLQELCGDEGIKFLKHKNFRLGFSNHQVDLFIEPNICIEVDGDWVHANPNPWVKRGRIQRGYKANKIMRPASKYNKIPLLAKDIWEKDRKQTEALTQLGNTVIRFWETELELNPDQCIQKIKKIIKKSRR